MLNQRQRLRDGSCMSSKRGEPKRDGSGGGRRANRGRGGCKETRNRGRGRNK